MVLEVGTVVEGKVTGITKFGAFVSLPQGKSGLVHISELANSYVSDVNEHVSVGQTVNVYIMSIAPDGKINLSIKRALTPGGAGPAKTRTERPQRQEREAAPTAAPAASPSASGDFEDMMKKFMRDSDSRIADNRMYSEHRQRSRRR